MILIYGVLLKSFMILIYRYMEMDIVKWYVFAHFKSKGPMGAVVDPGFSFEGGPDGQLKNQIIILLYFLHINNDKKKCI